MHLDLSFFVKSQLLCQECLRSPIVYYIFSKLGFHLDYVAANLIITCKTLHFLSFTFPQFLQIVNKLSIKHLFRLCFFLMNCDEDCWVRQRKIGHLNWIFAVEHTIWHLHLKSFPTESFKGLNLFLFSSPTAIKMNYLFHFWGQIM